MLLISKCRVYDGSTDSLELEVNVTIASSTLGDYYFLGCSLLFARQCLLFQFPAEKHGKLLEWIDK